MTFQVNHLSPFLLTNLLLEPLTANPDGARVLISPDEGGSWRCGCGNDLPNSGTPADTMSSIRGSEAHSFDGSRPRCDGERPRPSSLSAGFRCVS